MDSLPGSGIKGQPALSAAFFVSQPKAALHSLDVGVGLVHEAGRV